MRGCGAGGAGRGSPKRGIWSSGGDAQLGDDLEAGAAQRQSPFRAEEREPVVPRRRDLAARPAADEAGVLEERLEHVGRLADAPERVAAAHRRHLARRLVGDPLHDVDVVRQQVRGLAARVVPEPAEVVERALRVVRHEGRGPQPHVPVGRREPIADRLAEAGQHVAVRRHPHAADVADVARAHELEAALVVAAGALLRAHLHHALVGGRRLQHPVAFAHHVRQRLLDVDVLARGARQDRHERVPVVGRRDHDGVDVGPVEQLAEVLVRRGRVPRGRHGLREPRLAQLRDRGDLDVGLRLEVEQVPLADQAVADQPDPDAVVGAERPSQGGRAHHARARDRLEHRSPPLHVPLRGASRILVHDALGGQAGDDQPPATPTSSTIASASTWIDAARSATSQYSSGWCASSSRPGP